MFKFLKSLAIYAWVAVNAHNLVRIGACLLVILLTNFLYEKWETVLLAINPGVLLWLLIIYTFVVIVTIFFIVIFLSRFVFLKRPGKAIEAKKSFMDKPEEFERIKSVKLRPNLRSKSDSLTE